MGWAGGRGRRKVEAELHCYAICKANPVLASSLQLIAGFPEDMKEAVDVNANPCEDFYEFACGKWDTEHSDSIPAFKSQVAFAWDRADKSIRTSMTEVLEKDEGPAGLYFRSCMDLDHIEDVGTTQLEPWIRYIDAISDKASMVTAITEFNKHDMDNFFTWGIDTDNRDSSRKSFSIEQGGMTLPDNTYYLEDSDVMRQHREMMKKVVAKFFVKIGRADTADAEAQMILDFETEFAGIRVDRAEARKDQGTPTTWEHVNELMPYWPWKQWLQELGSCTAPPDGSAKVCTKDHDKVRLVGSPGEAPLYISNEPFFPKLNALLEKVSALVVLATVPGLSLSFAYAALSAHSPMRDEKFASRCWAGDAWGVGIRDQGLGGEARREGRGPQRRSWQDALGFANSPALMALGDFVVRRV